MPLISVIIPAYNCEAFIEAAIASIQVQTLHDFEVIVVDDGSTDGTLARIKSIVEADGRIKVIAQAHSGKPSIARNVGIRHSSGEFLCFLDGDDLFYPDKLMKQLELLHKHPDVNLVFHDVQFLYPQPRADEKSYLGRVDFVNAARAYMSPAYDNVYLCHANYYNFMSAYYATILMSAVMMRKSCLATEEVWFPEDMAIGEDIDLWFRLALKNKYAYIDEPLSYYRQHDSSITHDMARYLEGSIHVHRKNLNRGMTLLTDMERDKYAAKIRALHWHYGYLLYSNFQMRSARQQYTSALKLQFSTKAFIALIKTMLPVSFIRLYKTYLRA